MRILRLAWERIWFRIGIALFVLLASMWFYLVERSLEHFIWHVGYGAASGFLLGAAWARLRRPVADATAWGLIGYGWMVVPDLIWLGGRWTTGEPYPHQAWMDIFLLHVSLDHWSLASPMVAPTFLAALAIHLWQQRAARSRPHRSHTVETAATKQRQP